MEQMLSIQVILCSININIIKDFAQNMMNVDITAIMIFYMIKKPTTDPNLKRDWYLKVYFARKKVKHCGLTIRGKF